MPGPSTIAFRLFAAGSAHLLNRYDPGIWEECDCQGNRTGVHNSIGLDYFRQTQLRKNKLRTRVYYASAMIQIVLATQQS